jgi:type I restriction enzyme S subunit
VSSPAPVIPDLSHAGQPHDWRLTSLDDACEFLDSRRIPVNQTERLHRIKGKSESDLYPYYGATGQVGWINDYLFDEPLILLAEDGADFGSRSRPIAYAVTGRYWVNNHAHVLRPKPGVDFDFLLYTLMIRPDLGDLVSGSTRAKLNQAVAKRIAVPLPPLPEQKRISAALRGQLDAAARMRAAADAEADSADCLFATRLAMVFDSHEAREWPVEMLGDAGEIVSGVALGRKLNGRATRPVAYLRVANVKDGCLDLADVYTVEATEAEIAKLQLLRGDLLLTEGGDPDKLGRGAVWAEQLEECIHQNHIFRLRLDRERFVPEFVSFQLGSRYGKAYFARHAKQTTGIATINQRVLREFPLMAPPIAVQRRVADGLCRARAAGARLRDSLGQEGSLADALPASLLRRAFSGGSR